MMLTYKDYDPPESLEAVIDGKVVAWDEAVASRVAQSIMLLAVSPEHAAKLTEQASGPALVPH